MKEYNQKTCSYCGYKCDEGVHKCCNDKENNHCGVCCREIEQELNIYN